MTPQTQLLSCLDENQPRPLTKGPVHLNVTYALGAPFLAVVESGLSLVSAVYELVQDDNIPRVDVFSEGATGRGGQDVSTAKETEGFYVGSVVHVGWHEVVFAAMSVCE